MGSRVFFKTNPFHAEDICAYKCWHWCGLGQGTSPPGHGTVLIWQLALMIGPKCLLNAWEKVGQPGRVTPCNGGLAAWKACVLQGVAWLLIFLETASVIFLETAKYRVKEDWLDSNMRPQVGCNGKIFKGVLSYTSHLLLHKFRPLMVYIERGQASIQLERDLSCCGEKGIMYRITTRRVI